MNEESWQARTAIAQPRTTRREALIGGLFLAAGIAGTALKPRRHENLLGNGKFEQLVPKAFAGWRFETASGLVLPPADQLRDQLYSELLTRVYSHPSGPSVMLLIAYSGAQDGVIQVHRPEVCYPAGGYALPVIAPHALALANGVALPSRYIVAESDLRREQLVYWTRLGDHFPRTWLDQRIAVMEENIAGVIPDGVLVRVSTVMPGDARATLDGFARDLYAAVGNRMKTVMTGTGLAAVGGR